MTGRNFPIFSYQKNTLKKNLKQKIFKRQIID